MEADDSAAFFATRSRALLDKIATAMGKTIDDPEPVVDEIDSLDPEGDTDDL